MNEINEDENPAFEEDGPEVKSKSQVKRELHALKDLGGDLVTLSKSQLAKLPLSDDLLSAIRSAQSMKKGALKRQLQYIGKKLRTEDAEQIAYALEALRQPHKEDVARLHQLEVWRDALIDGDDNLLQEIIIRHPAVDRQHLRQLIRQADRERQKQQSPKASRQLFQYLKQLAEESS